MRTALTYGSWVRGVNATLATVAKARRRPPRHDETDCMAASIDALRAAGVWAHRCNAGMATYKSGARVRYGLGAGCADVICCHRGRLVAIEFKAARTGRQTQEQKAWQRGLEAAGGIYVLARSVPEALAWLQEVHVDG